MLSVENVATPLTAAMTRVPPSVLAPALFPIETVMLLVAVGTVLPAASCTATVTAGLIATPFVVLAGWTMNPSLLGGPTMLKALLTVPVRLVAVALSVYPAPALLML